MEKSKTIDIGVDIGILKDRITLMFDYFDRKTNDLLTNLALPSYIGFPTARTNWELSKIKDMNLQLKPMF
jgi:hypothetical protein